ncbi:MAG: hypothetical protein ABJF04_06885 [Reichenbachiella sp.]|uniref:hypothetical protein n=1 Tax=Reichenbachiella sp. TaxID=2184521 RepID=UPI003263CB17
MKNTKPSIIALIVFFVGWFLIGIGYGDAVPGPFNDILYVGGVVLFFAGLIYTIYLIMK